MRRLLIWTLALAVPGGGAAYAQEGVAGTWQGTMRAGQQDLRLVFVVSGAEQGGLRAMMYSIDQGGQGVSASEVLLRGSTLRIAIAAANGGFEGELSADGTSVAGTWTQGNASLPLTLTRATPETAWAIPEPPRPMAADAPAVFEVATIKPSNPNQPGKLFTVRGRQVLTINTTLTDLITFAYGLHAAQLEGGPSWMNSEKYDVTGQPEAPGIPNQEQLRAMVRQLLTDRFQLAFHRDTKEFTLTWTPDESQFSGLGVRVPPPSNDPNAPPGLFTAIQEQLGLKLESARAPAEVLVIDRVERPSEN